MTLSNALALLLLFVQAGRCVDVADQDFLWRLSDFETA